MIFSMSASSVLFAAVLVVLMPFETDSAPPVRTFPGEDSRDGSGELPLEGNIPSRDEGNNIPQKPPFGEPVVGNKDFEDDDFGLAAINPNLPSIDENRNRVDDDYFGKPRPGRRPEILLHDRKDERPSEEPEYGDGEEDERAGERGEPGDFEKSDVSGEIPLKSDKDEDGGYEAPPELDEDDEKPDDESKEDDEKPKKDDEESKEDDEESKEDDEKPKKDDKESKEDDEVSKEDEEPKEDDKESKADEEEIGDDEAKKKFDAGIFFDTPFFNVRQVSKYFQQLEKALEHVFRQTMDEATLLNGTYANTTEEEVEIDGKKYVVQKSIIKGKDKNNTIYIEALSTLPETNQTKVKDSGL